jgi:glutamate decarboxylase
VPAYTFPPDREDLAVLRIVCRNGFSHDMAALFLDHLSAAVDDLQQHGSNRPHPSGFRH